MAPSGGEIKVLLYISNAKFPSSNLSLPRKVHYRSFELA